MKQILVTGATGFIGKPLVVRLLQDGWRVHALTRDPDAAGKSLPREVEMHAWNPSGDAPLDLPEDISAVVHLAGESLARWPWSQKRKERLRGSRIEPTRLLVEALGGMRVKPDVLISASGMGYYGDCGEREVRVGDPPGGDFLGRLAAAWETEALKAERFGIRVALPRFGLVLDSSGGILPGMLRSFRLGLGAVLRSGDQYWSWIHREDAVSLVCRMLEDPSFQGPCHAVAGPR